MHTYIVKYKSLKVRIQLENKTNLFETAISALKSNISVKDGVLFNAFDNELNEFYLINNYEEAPNSGILTLEDPPTEESTTIDSL